MCDRYEADLQTAPVTPGRMLDALLVCVTNARVYARGHPRMAGAVAELHSILETLLEDTSFGMLDLGIADGYAFVNRQPLLGAGLSAARVIEAVQSIGAGGLRFKQPQSLGHLTKLSRLLSKPPPDVTSADTANAWLGQEDVTSVEFLPEFKAGSEEERALRGHIDPGAFVLDLDEELEEMRDSMLPYRTYQEIVDGLQEVAIHVMTERTPGLDLVQGGVEHVLKSLAQDAKTMLGICRYEAYDAFTFGHSIRVCSLALDFARHLTKNPKVLQSVGVAALLHDIGKVRVPHEILHAPGRLTQREFAEMRRHTEYGGEILLGLEGIDISAVQAAVCHHEPAMGHDNRPLPQTVVTRIVKICDVYEALTAVRPYKDAMPPVRAYRIMMSMGPAFDRALLRRFIETNGMYPVGTRVLLSNGDLGIVHAQTTSMLEPIIEIEKGYFRSSGERVDLSESTGRAPLGIEKVILKSGDADGRAAALD